jgi:hypothetical protein
MAMRMAGLALRRGSEQGSHIALSLKVSFFGKVQITKLHLRIKGKRLFETLLGAGALE